VKVGESQTSNPFRNGTIAKIYTHTLNNRQATTLYVRNIPILTFLGDQPSRTDDVKLGAQATDQLPSTLTNDRLTLNPSRTVATLIDYRTGETATQASQQLNTRKSNTRNSLNSAQTSDSMARASEIAAKLNQLYRDGIKADQIAVKWRTEPGSSAGKYVLTVEQEQLAVLDASTVSAETTRNPEQDALMVANRLRRLMGDGSVTPLQAVGGKPTSIAPEVATGVLSVRSVANGLASWYGPGFHGNRTANGEVFNQYAMTAAHRSLPFGTRVRVTNLDNGRSAVVRINDRGPYAGGRIIDMSAGSARQIGLDQSGVAPVRLEVLDNTPAEIASGF
jgi:rare lipoprotein A